MLVALVPFGWSAYVSARSSPVPDRIVLPAVAGWEVVPYLPKAHWTPRFVGASHYLSGRYRNAAGQEADLFVVVYDRQSEGRELVGFGQGAVDPDGHWSWSANMPAPSSGRAERIKTQGAARHVVSFYRVNKVTTGSAARAKPRCHSSRWPSKNRLACRCPARRIRASSQRCSTWRSRLSGVNQ